MIDFTQAYSLQKSGLLRNPEKDFGQMWFSPNGNLYIIARLSEEGELYGASMENTSWKPLSEMDDFVYRATLADMLAILQSRVGVPYWWAIEKVRKKETPFECAMHEGYEGPLHRFFGKTPEEACVVALLTSYAKE
jgi:hypothetical protein